MPTPSEPLAIRQEDDVVYVRKEVRRLALEMGFGLVDQTKIVTAASELARNTLVHGGGGEMRTELVEVGGGKGLRLVFADRGPGIADIEQALVDGFTTRGGLGLGLGGARRLVNEMTIDSSPGQGTRVTITKWR